MKKKKSRNNMDSMAKSIKKIIETLEKLDKKLENKLQPQFFHAGLYDDGNGKR